MLANRVPKIANTPSMLERAVLKSAAMVSVMEAMRDEMEDVMPVIFSFCLVLCPFFKEEN